MPSEKEVYASHAVEYEALVSHEDYQGNILKSIQQIVSLHGLDVLDLGAGTGRLACLLAPHVRTVLCFDLSPHMLGIARRNLRRLARRNWLVAASDHRFLPLKAQSADVMVSGWSVSYLAVWNPPSWRDQASAWLAEARRVLRPNGFILLFESLGTGNESPHRLPHLEDFYDWLDEVGFENKWIRTDYQFESSEEAGRVAGFFFGEEMKRRIAADRLTILPECTGVWWMKILR
ncbi:MAG TPA: class I SAM-dependent methyltransferase [Anaerolineales bacterium]|nr:class I SAM-dependent methyltransferase [Anaerolineales bacterium]